MRTIYVDMCWLERPRCKKLEVGCVRLQLLLLEYSAKIGVGHSRRNQVCESFLVGLDGREVKAAAGKRPRGIRMLRTPFIWRKAMLNQDRR